MWRTCNSHGCPDLRIFPRFWVVLGWIDGLGGQSMIWFKGCFVDDGFSMLSSFVWYFELQFDVGSGFKLK